MRITVPVLLLLSLATAQAADLLQLSAPAGMTITVYPGQTRALVRESWPLKLTAGDNAVSFSWVAANLDSASAALVVPGAEVGEAVRVAGQDKALSWKVTAPQALQTEALVTYFLEGFKWYPTYRLWLQPEAKTARLSATLHLTNQTGVDLGPAQLQVAGGGAGVLAGEGAAPPTILRAYGVGSLPEGATVAREMLQAPELPAELRHCYQAERFGGAVERLLILTLPEVLAGLPEGPLTIYDPAEDTLPMFNTQLTYQPGQELKVDLGPEPDVVVERKLMNTARSSFETDRYGRFTGSDTTEDYLLAIRNRTNAPITLELTETVLSTWEFKSALSPDKVESDSAQFHLALPPDQPLEFRYTLVKHSGTRAKKK